MTLGLPALAADPGYYLVTAYDNQSQWNIDYRYWTVKNKGSTEVVWPEIGLGYGVTNRWYTEVYASFIGSSNFATRRSSFNWQNDYLLTQGQYDIDVALHTNLFHGYGAFGKPAFEFGPVLQTEVGRLQLNGNLIFDRPLGAARGATGLKYQWQAKYHWKPELHFGLQGFGELGDWNHWAPSKSQSHRIGPMISGTLPMGAARAFKYEAALLSGSIYGQHGHMFTTRLQYVF